MSELRGIVKKVVPLADDHFVDNVTKLFMDWHKSEREKWALGLFAQLPHNKIVAEIRKKIEEGK